MTEELLEFFKNKADSVDQSVYKDFEEMFNLKFKGSTKRKRTLININSNINFIKIKRVVYYRYFSTETPKKNRDVIEFNEKPDYDKIPMYKEENMISNFMMRKFEFKKKQKNELYFLNTAEGVLFYCVSCYGK
mgnify:CR=1 FL=1